MNPNCPRSGDRGSVSSDRISRWTRRRRRGSSASAGSPVTAASAAMLERLPEDRAVLEQRPVRRIDGVEPRRDQGMQRARHLQRAQVADDVVDPAGFLELPVLDEHPDRLHPVERDAVRPQQDRPDRGRGKTRDEPGEELPHGGVGERPECQGDEVAPARAPVGAPLKQLRPGERDHQDRVADRPLQEVVDELDEAGVGPLEILEDENGRALERDALEERPPGVEELGAAARRSVADAEQREERRRQASPLPLVVDVLREGRVDTLVRPCRVVALEQAGAPPDHLAKRPERHTLAERGRAALVPVDGLGHAVDVLEELPGEPALADAGLARDRQQPHPALA